MEKTHHADTNQNKAGLTILISDRVDFVAKTPGMKESFPNYPGVSL